ncbi:probable transcription factor GLK1 [Musa acuminata AAA Group]|uniref:probable transcription factor GLK1 n=1 Tax=Musa acuminata AAA Group TaxID=214697 RepID=UPI0031D129F7
MLAVEALRGSNGEERDGSSDNFCINGDFTGETLLEDINFSDLFAGIDDGDMLPGLELDPAETFAEFSVGWEEDSGSPAVAEATDGMLGGVTQDTVVLDGEKYLSHGEEATSETTAEDAASMPSEARSSTPDNGQKSSVAAAAAAKGSQGKRKAKVDWTPDLHRRFVQAVEQLGIDKAVPSRILELMGIDCLTRHNVASHLQKYRSHRKHLLAREAEAASWSQRRQMYATGMGVKRVDVNPWLASTIGFLPPPPPPPPPPPVQPFRPLHVWGHPTPEAPVLHMWPRHLSGRSPTQPWAPPQPPLPPPPDPSYWHHLYQSGSGEGWVPHTMAKGAPCFPQPLPMVRFAAPPVPGVVPRPMYRAVAPAMTKHPSSQLQLDASPSKESIDAAIGDVLGKPWLPLPLGLKPPSLDGVLVELQRQGVSKVP